MEFDKSKILTVVTADQAKVGQKGWFGDSLEELKEQVKGSYPDELVAVRDESWMFRFKGKSSKSARQLFYPEPEPTYAERQAEWVKENNVKVGTKVRFTKGFDANEDGSWSCEHRDAMGKTGEIIATNLPGSVEVLVDWCSCRSWSVPYTALEVIKEPTYRPYNNDELNNLVGEVLTHKRSGRRKLVTGKPTASKGVNLDGRYINAKDLLYSFYRNGNEPCGVKEEA